jgi:hypothetical protein
MSGSFDAVQDGTGGYLPGQFRTYREPDAVRAAALANAVDLVAGLLGEAALGFDDCADYTLDLARRFEVYLTGEEANGQT